MLTKGLKLVAAGAASLMLLAACGGGGTANSPSPQPSKDAGASGSPAASAAPSTPAEEAQSLTIYTGRDKDEVAWVIAEFEKANPQYAGKVTSVIAGAQDNLDRLRAEKANPQAGFMWGGTMQQLDQAADEDLIKAVELEHGDKVPDNYKGASGKWVSEMLLPEVIIYNKNLVTEADAPKDWADLVKPEWKDKIVIRDVMPSGTMRTIYSAMVYEAFAKDGKPDAGYEFLKQLDANTVSYAANPDDMYTQLDQGVGVITLWNLQDALIQPLKNNRPWAYVMPTSGAPVLLDGVAVVNNPNQEKAATDFANFLMEPKMQAKLAADYYQLPAMEIDDADKPEWMKDFKLTEMKIDWKVFAEHQDEWMKYWAEKIKTA